MDRPERMSATDGAAAASAPASPGAGLSSPAPDHRTTIRPLAPILRPDASRVVLRPFTPAENGSAAPSARPRVERIVDRVLALSDEDVADEVARISENLGSRHDDFERVLMRRYYDMAERCLCGRQAGPERQLLIGAYFVEEYSFEATALFNPSILVHPDQSGMAPDSTRLLLSLRGVGEGHLSSIVFRTGEFASSGELHIDRPAPRMVSPHIGNIPGGAPDDPGVRLHYETADLSRIVIFPTTYHQRAGIEDLRLVRFAEEDGHVVYLGTYTAFSGQGIRQELLRTRDFKSFELNALHGELSATKGMALFPRRVDGHFAMLGRQDHENIWLLRSNELYEWREGEVIVSPKWPWEFVQLGNCGSPIEIDEGWLVITHGVGAVRNYCLGACLLDRRNPAKLLARSVEPLVRTSPSDRDGFVPNVAYSCGALALGRTLLLPYGVADTFTAFAAIAIDDLLATMQ